MSEKPDVTMGEMTKTNEKSGRKVFNVFSIF